MFHQFSRLFWSLALLQIAATSPLGANLIGLTPISTENGITYLQNTRPKLQVLTSSNNLDQLAAGTSNPQLIQIPSQTVSNSWDQLSVPSNAQIIQIPSKAVSNNWDQLAVPSNAQLIQMPSQTVSTNWDQLAGPSNAQLIQIPSQRVSNNWDQLAVPSNAQLIQMPSQTVSTNWDQLAGPSNAQIIQVPSQTVASGTQQLLQGSGSQMISLNPSDNTLLLSKTPTTMYNLGDSVSGSFPGGSNTVSLSPVIQSVQQHELQQVYNSILPTASTNSFRPVNAGIILPSTYSNNGGIIQAALSNPIPTQYPAITTGSSYSNRPEIIAIPNSMTQRPNQNFVVLPTGGNPSGLNSRLPNRGTLATITVPNYGVLQALLNRVEPDTVAPQPTINDVAASLQTPGTQAQVVQLPCTLHVPSPVPISIKPGVSQISTTLPIPQVSAIPGSYIDNTPPTIPILRPPSYLETYESGSLPIAAPAPVTSSQVYDSSNDDHGHIASQEPRVTTTIINQGLKQTPRSQDSQRAADQNDEEEFNVPLTPGSARDGLPIVYTMLPTSYSSGASTAAETPSKPRAKSPRPTRGKNPFFNVNKRKHFEFYQYF